MLQQRHGLDVNFLLFTCWLASRGIELDRSTLDRAHDAVSAWHLDVVGPLRALRRSLAVQLEAAKPESLQARWPAHVIKLRQGTMALELDSEHLAQLALSYVGAELQPTQKAGPALAVLNLIHFWRFSADDLSDLRTLLQQAFPATTAAQLTNALSALEA